MVANKKYLLTDYQKQIWDSTDDEEKDLFNLANRVHL